MGADSKALRTYEKMALRERLRLYRRVFSKLTKTVFVDEQRIFSRSLSKT